MATSKSVDSAPSIPGSLSQDIQALGRQVTEDFVIKGKELYLVGGAVRDALLGNPVSNLDFATSALPDETVTILEAAGRGKPYRVGERFGTIGVQAGSTLVEITTYRSAELYDSGSRKPVVQFGSSLAEDLQRRDFTVNSIAQDMLNMQLIDPMAGIPDLRAGVIRAVGDPVNRFREDPLRILRGVRLASGLGFDVELGTWSGLQASSPYLSSISKERIRDELSRMLKGPRPSRALNMLRDADLLRYAAPALMELTKMTDHGPSHPLSLWEHTLRVVDAVSNALELRWAAILHDLAKPSTRADDPDGRPRFFHHEEVGADMARDLLGDLRYSSQFIGDVALLIQTHMQLHGYSPDWSDGAVRRLTIRLGRLLPCALALARADAAAHGPEAQGPQNPKFDQLQARIEGLNAVGLPVLKSPLNGHDLMKRYRRPPGPWIQHIKSKLDDEVLEGRLHPSDTAAAWALSDKLMDGEE